MRFPFRRFVTGHDADGKSVFILDDVEPTTHVVGSGATRVTELWETRATPADNTGTADAADRPFRLPPQPNGTVFRVVEYPPDASRVAMLRDQQPHDDAGEGYTRDFSNAKHPGFHKTATIDYAIVLNGEIYALMDEGERLMRAGDMLVQRGTNHSWSNRTNEIVHIAFILIGRDTGLTNMSGKSLIRSSFSETVSEAIQSYVYRLVDPRTNRTFYVGKGTGNRVFQHVAEAADLPDRASLKLDLIREIEAAGQKVRYVIHRHGLTDREAFLIESSLIDAYEELTNAQLGHATHEHGLMTIDDLIGRYDAAPAEITIPTVLLNLRHQYNRDLTTEQLYERTRGHWVMRPDVHNTVEYAMAFAFGLIREVYRIDSWTRTAVGDIAVNAFRKADDTESKSKYRWSFTGSVAVDIREQYVGKSFPWTAQNAVRWVNC